jgi:hypothetical protein
MSVDDVPWFRKTVTDDLNVVALDLEDGLVPKGTG